MRSAGKTAVRDYRPASHNPEAVQPERNLVMDRLSEFLEAVKDKGLATGNLLGLLHIVIGRKIAAADGSEVSLGATWRELASLLKKVRWDPQAVTEIGVDPATLPPRDRQRYWYQAISQSRVDSPEAAEAAEKLAKAVRRIGYEVGPAPKG